MRTTGTDLRQTLNGVKVRAPRNDKLAVALAALFVLVIFAFFLAILGLFVGLLVHAWEWAL